MQYSFDAEFYEDGETIELISLALVAEDGRELYLQNAETSYYGMSDWIQTHVLPHLKTCPCCQGIENHEQGKCRHKLCPWRSLEAIRYEITMFLDPDKYGDPQIWSWCGGFDYVTFCQIFGTMQELPQRYPHYFRDIQQVLDDRDIQDVMLPTMPTAHNALEDAQYVMQLVKNYVLFTPHPNLTIEFWEGQGFQNNWGDAAVNAWPNITIMQKQQDDKVEYVILSQWIRNAVVLHTNIVNNHIYSWGSY